MLIALKILIIMVVMVDYLPMLLNIFIIMDLPQKKNTHIMQRTEIALTKKIWPKDSFYMEVITLLQMMKRVSNKLLVQ